MGLGAVGVSATETQAKALKMMMMRIAMMLMGLFFLPGLATVTCKHYYFALAGEKEETLFFKPLFLLPFLVTEQ